MSLFSGVRNSEKGASIYDIRIEGGGGVSPKEDVVREFSTVDQWGGSINPKNMRTSYMDGPERAKCKKERAKIIGSSFNAGTVRPGEHFFTRQQGNSVPIRYCDYSNYRIL